MVVLQRNLPRRRSPPNARAANGLTGTVAHRTIRIREIFRRSIEPGYFRTDFPDASSLVVAPNVIADYPATAGATHERAGGMNRQQPGDPAKLAAASIALADSREPPLRKDTLGAISRKLAFVAAQTKAWKALAAPTRFDA